MIVAHQGGPGREGRNESKTEIRQGLGNSTRPQLFCLKEEKKEKVEEKEEEKRILRNKKRNIKNHVYPAVCVSSDLYLRAPGFDKTISSE